jgi:hypothetical protein
MWQKTPSRLAGAAFCSVLLYFFPRENPITVPHRPPMIWVS